MELPVKVADVITKRDFTDEAEAKRALHVDEKGKIVDQKRGHGLCYAVKFDDNTIAWYDPDELQLF
jgi:acetylornithine/succinyldiaminopimelate/putrescine aminotransferase